MHSHKLAVNCNFVLSKMKKLFRNIDKFGKMLYNKNGGWNMINVYLDNCCYNRPFDDLRQEKIKLEARCNRVNYRNVFK